jgi:uncharacterized protein YeaO (DUF488 family)
MSVPPLEIQVARLYDAQAAGDHCRVLVDRVWPRGVRKDELDHELWLREVAPSDELRRWFGHDPALWPEFLERYHAELDDRPELIEQLFEQANGRALLLLYGARDTHHNNAVALKLYLEGRTP